MTNNKPSIEFEEVLAACKKSNAWAQKMLFEQYYGLGKKICLRYGSNKEEVSEMVNDGFLKVFANLERYDPNLSFNAWFRTVMVRSCIDYYRKNSPKVEFLDIQNQYNLESADHVIERLSAEEILALIQKLPPSYRIAFTLYVVEGYSHAEIAEKLEINEGTSRSNLAKARMKLQEWVIEYTNIEIKKKDHELF